MDKIINTIGFSFIALMVGFTLYSYPQLPDTIPIHFNELGIADNFGSKSHIWTLVIVGTAAYLIFFFCNQYLYKMGYLLPGYLGNSSEEIQENNKPDSVSAALITLAKVLNTVMAGSFFYIKYQTVQIAKGSGESLGKYFLPIVVIAVSGIILIYLILSLKSMMAAAKSQTTS